MKTVVGLYDKREDARNAIEALVDAGYSRDKISMATQSEENNNIDMLQSDKVKEYRAGGKKQEVERDREAGNEAGEGAAVGGTVGAVLGGIGGLLVGLGTLVIPGLGVIAAAGPIAGLLTGALAGGVAGGIVGALVGLGIPEEEAKVYAEGVRRGGILVAVQTNDDRAGTARTIMDRFNPIDIERRSEQWGEKGWEDRTMQGEDRDMTKREHTPKREHRAGEEHFEDRETIKKDIVEEELRVGKRQVDRGGVRIHSHVESEDVEENVTLRDERIDVERVKVDRELRDDEFDFGADEEEVIEMHETDEEVVVEKRPRVVGEVRVTKDVDTETETVRDTLHRRDVEVEDIGGRDRMTGRKEYRGDREMQESIDRYVMEHEQEFQQHYRTQFSNTGRDFSYFRPAYIYGCRLAHADQYQDRDWDDIEAEAHRNWREANDDESWFIVEDAVRTSYNSCHSS